MKTKKILGLVLALAVSLVATSPAHAALSKIDLKVAGDNKATKDSSTGLEWTIFGGTYNDALAALNTTYTGWRMPTWSEVQTLVTNVVGAGRFDKPGVGSGASYVTSLSGQQSADWTTYVGGQPFAMSDQGVLYVIGKWAGNFEVYTVAQPNGYPTSTYYQGVYMVSAGGATLSSQLTMPPAGSITASDLMSGTNYASVTLAYNPSGASGFTGFKYRVNGGVVQTSATNTISLTGLNAGTTYSIEYAAYNDNGIGTWYNTQITTEALPPQPTPVDAPLAMFGALLLVLGIRKKALLA